ncbi:MAG: recombinase family protein [Emergencia sp.]
MSAVTIWNMCSFLDVRFISVELPALDSYLRPEEISSIATKMQSYMNDQHCYQTSIKIRSVLDMKRSQGQFIGAFAPYGYLKDPNDYHRLIVNPETAPVVQDIFRWYVYEGMNKNAIARKLIDLGIPSPTAYKQQLGLNYHNPHAQTGKVYWSDRTIVNMLKNPTYLGHMVQGRASKAIRFIPLSRSRRKIGSGWKTPLRPLSTKETYERAQELLERNVRTSRKQKRCTCSRLSPLWRLQAKHGAPDFKGTLIIAVKRTL